MFCYDDREHLSSYLVVPNILSIIMSTLTNKFSGSKQWHEFDDAIYWLYLSARETSNKMTLRLYFRAISLPVVFLEALAPPESFVFPLFFSFTANRRASRSRSERYSGGCRAGGA